MSLHAAFGQLAKSLNASLVDREEEVSCILVALAAGEHTLFVGPPGTGKSLLCDNLTKAVGGARSFQRLITKHSEPSELFGPISIRGLKEDRMEHVIDGFLPTADIAFVDEIGKSSPAIINSLLTVMNERKFDNGPNRIDCPLTMLMGASNEWPVGEGFETCAALFDRFVIRKSVDYVSPTSMARLLWGEFKSPEVALTKEDVRAVQRDVEAIGWTSDGQEALLEILDSLRAEGIRVSDRRAYKARKIAQAAAWLHGMSAVEPQHLEVLQHVLWEDPIEHPKKAAEVVIGVANPAAKKLAQLLSEAQELMTIINPRRPSESLYNDIAKLKEVAGRLREIPGDRAMAAVDKVTAALKRYNAILLES